MATKLNQYRGRLSAEEVAAGMRAANQNARRLVQGARSLLESERFPTAAALAVLAIEEAGRLGILRTLALARDEADRKAGWREYRQHRAKNRIGGIRDLLISGARKLQDFSSLLADDAEHAVLLDQIKQLALYTDCLGEKHWSSPEHVVEEGLAKALVCSAEAVTTEREVSDREVELWIEHVGPAWRRKREWMEGALSNWYAAMREEGLMAGDPDAMEAFIRVGLKADAPPSDGPEAERGV